MSRGRAAQNLFKYVGCQVGVKDLPHHEPMLLEVIDLADKIADLPNEDSKIGLYSFRDALVSLDDKYDGHLSDCQGNPEVQFSWAHRNAGIWNHIWTYCLRRCKPRYDKSHQRVNQFSRIGVVQRLKHHIEGKVSLHKPSCTTLRSPSPSRLPPSRLVPSPSPSNESLPSCPFDEKWKSIW